LAGQVLIKEVDMEGTIKVEPASDGILIPKSMTDKAGYIQSIKDELMELADMPHTIKDGKKIYGVSDEDNIDYQCLLMFCIAIRWDEVVCNMLVKKENIDIRNDVISAGFAQLAVWAIK